jgi:DNA repair photolyase
LQKMEKKQSPQKNTIVPAESEKKVISSIPALRQSYIVDAGGNGIRFGASSLSAEDRDPRRFLRLALENHNQSGALRKKYSLERQGGLQELEQRLQGLSRRGGLRQSVITFGVESDPFYPFEGKFDVSMRFLEIFQRYTPALLQVQTRSPLAVIALPIFKRLGEHCSVTIGLETHREDLARRYTPELPRVEERLKTARALRRFGVHVHLQVGPVLPYGDWKLDAPGFAEILAENADSISLFPLFDGSKESERQVRTLRAAKMIAEERAFHYLRQDAHVPLQLALEKLAPEKLRLPKAFQVEKRQLEIFAA